MAKSKYTFAQVEGALDKAVTLKNSDDGTKFLADDGTYKTVPSSSGGTSTATDVLDGKKILCIGDSICEGVGTTGGNTSYAYYLKQLHSTANIINLGVGGMTISKKDSSVTNCIPDRIANGEFDNSEYANPDIILFEGGINDMMRNVKLGYVKQTYTQPTKYAEFCDAMDYMFYYFKTKFPKARMIFTSIHLIANSTPVMMQKNWWDCTAEVCAKWGVEYVNMFASVNANFVSGLTLHPNSDVHEKYYTPILDKVLCGAVQTPITTTDWSLKNRILSASYYSGTKTFNVGDTVSTSDWRVNGVRTDLTTYANITSQCTFDTSDVDNSVAGSYPIHVSFVDNGKADGFDAYVDIVGSGEKTLSSISATKTTTSTTVGTSVDNSDIVVTAHYSDGTTSDVTSSATIDNSNVNTALAGSYSILITYTEGSKTENTSIEYNVTSSGGSDTPSGDWDDEATLNALWGTANLENTTYQVYNNKTYNISFTAMATTDVNAVKFQLATTAKTVDFVANEPQDVTISYTANVTGNEAVKLTASGNGTYPTTIKIKNFACTEVTE